MFKSKLTGYRTLGKSIILHYIIFYGEEHRDLYLLHPDKKKILSINPYFRRKGIFERMLEKALVNDGWDLNSYTQFINFQPEMLGPFRVL